MVLPEAVAPRRLEKRQLFVARDTGDLIARIAKLERREIAAVVDAAFVLWIKQMRPGYVDAIDARMQEALSDLLEPTTIASDPLLTEADPAKVSKPSRPSARARKRKTKRNTKGPEVGR